MRCPKIFFLVLSTSFVAYAQPLGILSSEGRQESKKQVLSSPGGRFVFGQISDSGKDQFMLDTKTGRLWRLTERGDIGMYLINIPYCIAEGKYAPLPEQTINSADK
ncbi:exported hypothetical protein [uncultured Desulfobacterium sp.]|uniref:Uncharacterized protein n=1 Tax=uncultured Desulfobacterium sp. TaxID=201089 RepID=A0A445N2S1_9BACT|nr:exported hypothetical protein [uncultured Desulfobacterium sp.]